MKRKAGQTRTRKAQAGAKLPARLAETGPRSQTVLLAVTGMSPAVLTETIWALAREGEPIIPDRAVVVTTLGGRQAIERELLSPIGAESPTLWQELRLAILGGAATDQERLILEPPRLIEVCNPRTGQTDWLEDLRTPADNMAAANFLLTELRRWTETPGTRLVLSIAGGRKTMGALLYAAASLVCCESDRLTHVLVNEPFDDPRLNPKFHFPRQSRQRLQVPDGRLVQASDARIELADIPFVPFRNLFKRDLIQKPLSFIELVHRCTSRVAELARRDVRLKLAYGRAAASINGRSIKLSPLQAVLLLFLAENAKRGTKPPEKYEVAIEPLEKFAERLRSECVVEDGQDWRDQAIVPDGFDGQRVRKLLDELKGKLRQAGPEAACLIPLLPEKGRFTLDLPPNMITLS